MESSEPPPSPSEQESIAALVKELHISNGLIKDRSYRLKSYKKVATGSDIAKWFLDNGKVKTKEEAIELGQKLIKYKHLRHVVDEHNFKDEELFYRFYRDETSITPEMNASAVSMSADCTLKGSLVKKGKYGRWNNRFFVLKAAEKRLYYYETETSTTPKQIIDLNYQQIDVNECGECKPGNYCFNLITKNRIHTQCAPKSVIQEEWINALVGVGCTWLEEVHPEVTASSVYDFKVLDLDKQEVDLGKFRGKVCLVVNVASF